MEKKEDWPIDGGAEDGSREWWQGWNIRKRWDGWIKESTNFRNGKKNELEKKGKSK